MSGPLVLGPHKCRKTSTQTHTQYHTYTLTGIQVRHDIGHFQRESGCTSPVSHRPGSLKPLPPLPLGSVWPARTPGTHTFLMNLQMSKSLSKAAKLQPAQTTLPIMHWDKRGKTEKTRNCIVYNAQFHIFGSDAWTLLPPKLYPYKTEKTKLGEMLPSGELLGGSGAKEQECAAGLWVRADPAAALRLSSHRTEHIALT